MKRYISLALFTIFVYLLFWGRFNETHFWIVLSSLICMLCVMLSSVRFAENFENNIMTIPSYIKSELEPTFDYVIKNVQSESNDEDQGNDKEEKKEQEDAIKDLKHVSDTDTANFDCMSKFDHDICKTNPVEIDTNKFKKMKTEYAKLNDMLNFVLASARLKHLYKGLIEDNQ